METLSSCIAEALQQRGDDEVMFAMVGGSPRLSEEPCKVDHSHDANTVTVTKETWCHFVSLFKDHYASRAETVASFSPAKSAQCEALKSTGHRSDRYRCDIGLYCADTFYACLAESACLSLGYTFCVFRPDDPPLRLVRLEERRRPRLTLNEQDTKALLEAAFQATHEAARLSDTVAAGPISFPNLLPDIVCTDADSNIAYYMHTSGSTGDPKCVVASRGNLHAYLRSVIHARAGLNVTANPSSRLFCLSSPFFDPSIGDTLAVLCTPHSTFYTCPSTCLLNGQLGTLLRVVEATHVVSTPAVWGTVSAAAASSSAKDATTTSSRQPMKVFLGGERMSQGLINDWADRVELYNIYGVTEVTIYQSIERVLPGAQAATVRCGSGRGTRIAVDADEGTVSGVWPKNMESTQTSIEEGFGEVVLYGDQVCCGYADELESVEGTPDTGEGAASSLSSSAFGQDPVTGSRFFRTGDLGRLVRGSHASEPPRLELRGRRDWQIKLNGQRVSVEEVEGTVQRALEGMFVQCACFCVKGSPSSPASFASSPVIGAALVCCDVASQSLLAAHQSAFTEALKEVLAFHLPAFMIPQRWLLYAKGTPLPQTATGKVHRNQLAALAAAETQKEEDKYSNDTAMADTLQRCESFAPVVDPLYVTVRSAWEQVLGLPVHADTHYLHAGGDSLGALKLVRAIYLALHGGRDDGIDEHGGLPVPFQPCVLLRHPRFADYVAVLRCECDTAATASVAPFSISGDLDAKEHRNSEVTTASHKGALVSPTSRWDVLFREVITVHSAGLAERLLQHGSVDVNGGNTRAHRCATPLHVAVASCEGRDTDDVTPALKTVEVLLRYGARLTAVTPDGVTPAHLAAAVSAPVLRVVLARGSTSLVHCRDNRQQSLLHFACRSGNVEAVRLLLMEHAARLDTRDKWQRTPVHWAVLNGHVEVLEEVATYVTSASNSVGDGTGDMACDARDEESGTGKRGRRSNGDGTARFARLARKKTYLTYETLCDIAQRVRPDDAQLLALCRRLSPIVGEYAPPTP